MKREIIRPQIIGPVLLSSLLLLPAVYFWFEKLYVVSSLFALLFVIVLIASRLPFLSLDSEFLTYRRFFKTNRIPLDEIENVEQIIVRDSLAFVSETSNDWLELGLQLRDGSHPVIHLGSFGKTKVNRIISILLSLRTDIHYIESEEKTL